MKKNLIWLPFLLFCHANLNSISKQQWTDMQKQYHRLTDSLDKTQMLQLEQSCEPLWLKLKTKIRDLILGPINPDFISNSPLTGNMVRQGWSNIQKYEQCFLDYCIGDDTKALIARTKDASFSGLKRECKAYNCSTSTIGHLYYAARSLEQFEDKNIASIVEFGAGYGNLARIFKEILPNTTYYIIDLPELIAIQSLFLKANLPNTEIVVHTQVPTEFTTGAVHLIPVYLADQLNLSTDLFVSTFAISEGSEIIQKKICDKQFFNAKTSYIIGTLPGHDWAHHSIVHKAVRATYKLVECHPSYLLFHPGSLQIYEMIGLNR